MTMQDSGSGVALWRQVADGIERSIAAGTFAAGEKLPGESRDRRNLSGQPPHRAPGAGRADRTRLGARRARQRHLCRSPSHSPIRCARARAFPRSSAPAAVNRPPVDRRIAGAGDARTRPAARREGRYPAGAIETLRLADQTPICVGTTWLAAARFPEAGRSTSGCAR